VKGGRLLEFMKVFTMIGKGQDGALHAPLRFLWPFATISSNVVFVDAIAESIPFAPAWLLE
jgi:hypothetical protein